MLSRDRVAVAWCDPGHVDGAFAADMMMLGGARRDRLAELIRLRGSGILARTRNIAVAQFLDRTDAAWLWMVDTDHKIPLTSFDLLIESAHAKTVPVVAGMYFAAYPSDGPYPTPVPVAYTDVDGSFTPIRDIHPGRLRRVDAVGTGSLLVHRSVVQAMRDDAEPGYENWCWFADGPTGDGRWMSEDLTFCRRLGQRGVPIHVHTGAVFPHHKDFWQDEQTYSLWRRNREQ